MEDSIEKIIDTPVPFPRSSPPERDERVLFWVYDLVKPYKAVAQPAASLQTPQKTAPWMTLIQRTHWLHAVLDVD